MTNRAESIDSIALGIDAALNAAHVKSPATDELLKRKTIVRGYDFDHGLDHHKLLESFINSGFQSTLFARAVKEVNTMVKYFSGLCTFKSLVYTYSCTPPWSSS